MRILFKTEGGVAFFPGLSGVVVFDTDELPKGEGANLERRVEEACFFSLPPKVGEQRPGATDHRRYEISVQDDARGHTVRTVEPVEDPGLRALVEALDAKAKALRRATRSGGEDGDVEQ